MPMKKLVVLISGSGTNLQAIIDAIEDGSLKASLEAVISNKSDVSGLERARKHGADAITINHKNFVDRSAFDHAMATNIDHYQPDLVVLAGFMRILTPEFVNRYHGKMLNVHPSRLPLFKGLKTHQRALDAGEKTHGSSIHFVTAELDGGPVILQSSVNVHPDHSSETLANDVQLTEYMLYPLAIRWFCEGNISLNGEKVVYNGQIMQKPLQLHEV